MSEMFDIKNLSIEQDYFCSMTNDKNVKETWEHIEGNPAECAGEGTQSRYMEYG